MLASWITSSGSLLVGRHGDMRTPKRLTVKYYCGTARVTHSSSGTLWCVIPSPFSVSVWRLYTFVGLMSWGFVVHYWSLWPQTWESMCNFKNKKCFALFIMQLKWSIWSLWQDISSYFLIPSLNRELQWSDLGCSLLKSQLSCSNVNITVIKILYLLRTAVLSFRSNVVASPDSCD